MRDLISTLTFDRVSHCQQLERWLVLTTLGHLELLVRRCVTHCDVLLPRLVVPTQVLKVIANTSV